MATSHSVERRSFASRSGDETTEFFREMYVGNRTSFSRVTTDSGFGARFAGVNGLRADSLRGDLTMSVTAEPLNRVLFGQLQRGQWEVRSRGQAATLGPNDCVMYPVESYLELDAIDFDFRVVSLPLARVTAFAAAHADVDAVDLRFDSMRPVSTALARHFSSTLMLIHRELDAPDSAATTPLVAEQLTQMAAAVALATFPNTSMTGRHTTSGGRVMPLTIRRAVAFIEEHPGDPMGLSEIATAAGTTGRSVQLGFRRHLGVTPMTYLRRVRLDRAHQELRAADPTKGVTVSQVAARWGFGSYSRFSSLYRAEYGVPPSHTLNT